jgi:hypothetical protein
MFVVSVTLFSFMQVCMLDSHEGMLLQQAVLTSDSMHVFVLSQLIPVIRCIESLYPSPSMQF